MNNGNEPPTFLQRLQLHRASRLLAALTQLRLDTVLCDVLLQSQKVASETPDEKPAKKAASEAVNGTTGEASGEATGEATSEAAGEATSEAAGQTAEKTASEAHGVSAHRAVLAAASNVFNRLLSGTLDDDERKKRVVVEGVEQETLQALVEYIYSPASLTLTVENASELTAAATLLEVPGVRETAHEFMKQVLDIDNALHVHDFAKKHNYAVLAAQATLLIEDNGEQILQGNQILTLPAETLAAFLDRDRLNALEQLVLDTVLRWVAHRREERKQHLHMLLNKVRLKLVPREILSERVKEEPLKTADPEALNKIIEVLSNNESIDRLQKTAARERFGAQDRQSSTTQPHYTQSDTQCLQATLLVAGGKVGKTCTDTVLVCSLPAGRWESVKALPQPRNSAGSVLLDGRFYVIAGDNGSSVESTVFEYDAATNSWLTMDSKLKEARNWLGAAELGRRLYAVGGWSTDRKNLNSAEALDPREGVWRPIAPMTTGRRALGVATLENKLYAVGGHDGNSALNTTERYDPTANKWELMQDMKKPRAGVGVAVVAGVMYAVGGIIWSEDKATAFRSVEEYRAGSRWTLVQPMAEARRSAAVTADNRCLYVAGGFYKSKVKNTGKVWMFDTATNEWTEPLPELPESRAGASAVVLYK